MCLPHTPASLTVGPTNAPGFPLKCSVYNSSSGHVAMIGKALAFLKDKLNEGLSSTEQEIIVFPDAACLDPLTFQAGKITLLLANIGQEPALRSTGFNIRQAAAANGLNLLVLFVSSLEDYAKSLDQLSGLISYLQSNPVFEGPALPAGVNQLVLDAVTLSISSQNELCGVLRVSCRPSALYQVRVVSSMSE